MTSQTRHKRTVSAHNKTLRSVFPHGPKHGKHTELQGFPNTRGLKGSARAKAK